MNINKMNKKCKKHFTSMAPNICNSGSDKLGSTNSWKKSTVDVCMKMGTNMAGGININFHNMTFPFPSFCLQ